MPKKSNSTSTEASPKPVEDAHIMSPKVTQAPDFKTIYTNWVNGSFSPLDVFLIVGELMVMERNEPVVIQRAKIVMSPMEAKIVSMILVGAVRGYEKQFGSIAVPDQMMPKGMESD